MGFPLLSKNKNNTSDSYCEEECVKRIRDKGDRKAFEKIFRNYYKRLVGFAYKYVERSDKAEDIVQSVFLRIWAQKESWDPGGAVKQYLFNAVRNESLNELRHQKVVEQTEEAVTRRFKQIKKQSGSEKDLEVVRLQKNIQKGIDQLPPRCRQIFRLSRKNGLTYSEIADHLDISVNTVSTQMGRALKKLRDHLSDYLSLFEAAE